MIKDYTEFFLKTIRPYSVKILNLTGSESVMKPCELKIQLNFLVFWCLE